jgi:hypothetical protein
MLKMNLLQNAYDFLNSSLYYATMATEDVNAWKFAIINLVQATELSYKECLRRIHPVLVYEDIDKRNRTVSLALALKRLTDIACVIDAKDKYVVDQALKWRNDMMHYEIHASVDELTGHYSLLFEHLTSFHLNQLSSELHTHIKSDYWDKEADLMEFFRQEFITYNGVHVRKDFPREIVEAQKTKSYTVGDKVFTRVPYGQEKAWLVIDPHFASIPCHDCAVLKGQLHVPGCDVEECPNCGEPAFGCGCLACVPN